MAKEEYITDHDTRTILGIIETKDNGDKVAKDFASRRILGYYKKSCNCTTDFIGRKIADGDAVVSLIYNNRK